MSFRTQGEFVCDVLTDRFGMFDAYLSTAGSDQEIGSLPTPNLKRKIGRSPGYGNR